MNPIDRYLLYIRSVRRYSDRTADLYKAVLERFYAMTLEGEEVTDRNCAAPLNPSEIRRFIVAGMDEENHSSRTANLNLSVLSGFCRFLIRDGVISTNPVRLVPRPKMEKRLPVFFKADGMKKYFESTSYYSSRESLDVFLHDPFSKNSRNLYKRRLGRLVVSILYSLGLRRSELISLRLSDVDFGRKVVRVTGKGNKMREIPLIPSLCEDFLLYLEAVDAMIEGKRSLKEPLLMTDTGRALYPVYVDRVIKKELGNAEGLTGRKSPHVLRHSLATELLNDGAELNSIKELLGHSSLAATQVYTHNTIAKLKTIYESAHPRAKNGGKYGD